MASEARMSAECFPPGDFIREEIASRGWSNQEAQDRLAWGPLLFRCVLNGDYDVTEMLADDLALAFGTSPQYWLNLERMYRDWVAERRQPRQED